MNKLDNFFNKRLSDFNSSEDGWNVPSDQLWENAKPYFPKKKKRRFLFWWPFLLLALFSGGAIGFYANQLRHEKSAAEIATSLDIENPENITQHIALKYAELKNGKKKSIEEKSVPPTKIWPIKNPFSVINPENKIGSTFKRPIQSSSTFSPELDHSSATKSALAPEKNTVLHTNSPANMPEDIRTPRYPALELLPIGLSPFLGHIEAPILNNKLIFPDKKKNSHREIGIFSSYYRFNTYKNNRIEGDSEIDQIFLSVQNSRNINMYYSQWVAKNWSLSLGAHLLKFDIDIPFSIFTTYEGEDINNFVNQQYENSAGIANRSNSASSLELLTDVELLNGDAINLRGDLLGRINAVQIPFFVNRHFEKNKFEFIIGLAASLDLVSLDVGFRRLDIFKDQQLLNEPYTETELYSLTEYDWSLFTQMSVRYFISDHINVGIGARISVFDALLNSVDFGLYYRWHR